MTRHFGFTVAALVFCFGLVASAADQVPWATTPVDRFYQFDPGLYRGAAPTTLEQMVELKNIGIQTIVSFQGDKKQIAWEHATAAKLGMRFISIPLNGVFAPKDEQVERIQKILNTPELRPTFIHCTHGRERAGVETAIYRVFTDGWTPERAWNETVEFGFRQIDFPMREYFERVTKNK